MKEILPNNIWILEDEPDAVHAIRKYLNADKLDSKITIKSEKNIEQAKLWFKESQWPPDVFLLDICLNDKEIAIVSKPNKTFEDFVKLSEVSGIEFLAWVRCEWPFVPVCIMSAYWDEEKDLPHLAQHAVCNMLKRELPSIGEILWIAQQAIIGIRLPDFLIADAKNIIDKVNSIQNYFYFILCDKETTLIAPPKKLNTNNTSPFHLRLLFEVWNNRVLGLIEDISLQNTKTPFHPTLPFSRSPLSRFSIRLSAEIDFMGKEYLAPYLLRELTRTAYSLFFNNIKPHPVKTGECVFDNSTYPPDLLRGIERGEICPKCVFQMTPYHAYGGWSEGRNKAAKRIAEFMEECLKDVYNEIKQKE